MAALLVFLTPLIVLCSTPLIVFSTSTLLILHPPPILRRPPLLFRSARPGIHLRHPLRLLPRKPHIILLLFVRKTPLLIYQAPFFVRQSSFLIHKPFLIHKALLILKPSLLRLTHIPHLLCLIPMRIVSRRRRPTSSTWR